MQTHARKPEILFSVFGTAATKTNNSSAGCEILKKMYESRI